VRETCLDESGAPSQRIGYYASRLMAYDALGRLVRESYLDEGGAPMRFHKYAAYLRTTDIVGNELSVQYLDEQGQPTPSADGCAQINGRNGIFDHIDTKWHSQKVLAVSHDISHCGNDRYVRYGLIRKAEFIGKKNSVHASVLKSSQILSRMG
jgi:hypothetical protein